MVLPASGYTASAPQPTYAPVGNQSVAPQRPRRTISIQVSGGYNSGPYGGVRPGQPIYGQQPIRY